MLSVAAADRLMSASNAGSGSVPSSRKLLRQAQRTGAAD